MSQGRYERVDGDDPSSYPMEANPPLAHDLVLPPDGVAEDVDSSLSFSLSADDDDDNAVADAFLPPVVPLSLVGWGAGGWLDVTVISSWLIKKVKRSRIVAILLW